MKSKLKFWLLIVSIVGLMVFCYIQGFCAGASTVYTPQQVLNGCFDDTNGRLRTWGV